MTTTPMPPDVLAAQCPSREVLRLLTSRWAPLILIVLKNGTFRFAEIRRSIGGISERMLAETLSNLCAAGMVLRTDHGEIPPRVDYRLTPLGVEAADRLREFADWIEQSLPRFAEAGAD